MLMKGFPLSSFQYSSMQQMRLIPACLMILAQLKHGQQVVYSLHPSVFPIPTSIIADSSACRHRHWSSCFPSLLLHRSHPMRQQEGISLGVPLYPVDTTLFQSLTMTAPTEVFMQFDLRLAMSAIFMKYWSQVGLKQRMTSLSLRRSQPRSSSLPPRLSTLARTNSRHSWNSSRWKGSSNAMSSLAASMFSCRAVALRKLRSLCWKLASTNTMLRQLRFFNSSKMWRSSCGASSTALGVSLNCLQHTSLMYFAEEMLGGLRRGSARKIGRLQSEFKSSATSSRPQQGRPIRRILKTSVSAGSPSIKIIRFPHRFGQQNKHRSYPSDHLSFFIISHFPPLSISFFASNPPLQSYRQVPQNRPKCCQKEN